jgi:hypothetical protein
MNLGGRRGRTTQGREQWPTYGGRERAGGGGGHRIGREHGERIGGGSQATCTGESMRWWPDVFTGESEMCAIF